MPSQTPQMSIVADELAPELQGQNSEGDKSSRSAPEPIDPKRQAFYTAYESPLQRFKAYRYHPQYSHSVSGGYRSLTYSHEIDPMKPICPFETAGGICNDSACDGQHFRAMSISEDKILVQLGIVNPGRTPEEQEQWRVGLKQVLKGLREDNVRDAESVAAAITKYRREFLQDPSRVLNI
ncbi:protein red1 [Neofusicoccum parvum]|uniref:Protein red1 n=1 Tax=Neofusicoccum parvum TaxID=310453 RepID=A0ACB5SNI3_9PEZI|nr:protein red1 [Neofusicoccum parvum]